MAGYWQRPDETAKVMTEDGYFKTGDIGVMDERGYFQGGRSQEGHGAGQRGFNVYPNEVEDVVAPDTRGAGMRRCRCPTRRRGRP